MYGYLVYTYMYMSVRTEVLASLHHLLSILYIEGRVPDFKLELADSVSLACYTAMGILMPLSIIYDIIGGSSYLPGTYC